MTRVAFIACGRRAEHDARRLEAELSSARARLQQLEASLAGRDKDVQRLQRLAAEAEAAGQLQAARADDFMRKVEADLGLMRSRTAQLTGLIKAKEREAERLTKALEATRGSEHGAATQVLRLQEELQRADAGAATLRQQLAAAEGAAKARSREAERLAKQLEGVQAAEAAAIVQHLQVSVFGRMGSCREVDPVPCLMWPIGGRGGTDMCQARRAACAFTQAGTAEGRLSQANFTNADTPPPHCDAAFSSAGRGGCKKAGRRACVAAQAAAPGGAGRPAARQRGGAAGGRGRGGPGVRVRGHLPAAAGGEWGKG